MRQDIERLASSKRAINLAYYLCVWANTLPQAHTDSHHLSATEPDLVGDLFYGDHRHVAGPLSPQTTVKNCVKRSLVKNLI